MYDYLIKNGKIINGIDAFYREVDLAISDDKIAEIVPRGSIGDDKSRNVVDANGLIVAPGFIDIHSHDDFSFWYDPYIEGKLRQGVTTVMVGNCGNSAAPLPANDTQAFKDFKLSQKTRTQEKYPWTAKNVGDYLQELQDLNLAINVLTAVGHNSIRITVMGYDDRKPSEREINEMKDLVRESMVCGAVGFSSGLIYPPGSYADTQELIELAKIASDEGGIYFTHLRSESHSMKDALNEAILIGKSANIPVEVNHFKCLGKSSWGDAKRRLALLKEARNEGLRITCDQYPYKANATRLINLLPPRALKDGVDNLLKKLHNDDFRNKIRKAMTEETQEWENFLQEADGWNGVMISQAPGLEEFEGFLVTEIVNKTGNDPFDQVFDIIIETEGSATMVLFTMNDQDVEEIMKFSGTCIGSDGMPGPGKVHPRFFGTFPRVLSKFVREDKVIDIFEAVKKMTSLPSFIINLKDRGVIKKKKRADLVIFDFNEIEDKADYKNPSQYPKGIPHVMVGGKFVIRDYKITGQRTGKVGY